MLTSRHPHRSVRRSGSKVLSTPWEHRPVEADDLSRLARLCEYLDTRRWVVAAANVVAAALFVVGCVGFYWPRLYTGSVTAFLCGSVLFLLGALCSALLEHGPST
jgi:YrhK-like protein